MLDNNGPVLQGCSQKNEVSKRTENLVFLKSFSGSKCKKSRDDSYESQMDTDGATQEHSSVSENISLEKRPNEVNVTAVCSSSYVTTNSWFKYILNCRPKARPYFRSTFKLRFEIVGGSRQGTFLRT